MSTRFLSLLSMIPVSGLAGQGVLADVAPPGPLLAISLGAMIVLGILVTGIVLVSFLVIRRIKKKHNPKDGA